MAAILVFWPNFAILFDKKSIFISKYVAKYYKNVLTGTTIYQKALDIQNGQNNLQYLQSILKKYEFRTLQELTFRSKNFGEIFKSTAHQNWITNYTHRGD